MKPISNYVQVNGLQLHYFEWGSGSSNILLLHGISTNSRFWDSIILPLMKEDKYRFIALDLRGRGNSAKPEQGYSLSHHCSDIIGLLNYLGLQQVICFGHSFGASVAIYLASHHPQRIKKLVLFDGGGSDLSPEQMKEFLRDSVKRADLEFSTLDGYYKYHQQLPAYQPWTTSIQAYLDFDAQLTSYGQVHSKVSKRAVLEDLKNMRLDYQMKRWLALITCPTLLLRATEQNESIGEPFLSEKMAEMMVSILPHGHYENISGCNHFTLLLAENKERDNIIAHFLEDIS